MYLQTYVENAKKNLLQINMVVTDKDLASHEILSVLRKIASPQKIFSSYKRKSLLTHNRCETIDALYIIRTTIMMILVVITTCIRPSNYIISSNSVDRTSNTPKIHTKLPMKQQRRNVGVTLSPSYDFFIYYYYFY